MILGRNKFIGGLAVAIMLAGSMVAGFAHQGSGSIGGKRGSGGHAERGGIGRMFSGVDLSDAQKTQIQQITARYEQSTTALREQLRALHSSSSSAADPAQGGTFNEAQVRQAAQARAALQVELEVSAARMKSEMYAVLTPEQRTKLIEQRQQWEQRRQQQRQRPGSSAPSATTL